MYRRNVNTFSGLTIEDKFRAAFQQNEPFFIPSGTIVYLRDSDGIIDLDACPDVEADQSVELRVRGVPVHVRSGRPKLTNLRVTGAITTDTLLSYQFTNGETPGFEMTGVVADVCSFVQVDDYNDTRDLIIGHVAMADCHGTNQRHAIDLQGAIRSHELANITLEDFKERGITVGSGKRPGQLRMESGTVRGLRFRRGIPSGQASNNFNLWHGGRNVEISDVVVEDWPNVQKPNGSWHNDNEALYTKVDGLTIYDIQLLGCGGSGANSGIWGNKGAHPAAENGIEIDGRNTVAENFVIDAAGVVGPRTALWLQCYGPCTHAKFKVIGCAGVGYRMHENCNGDYIMREWDVWGHAVPQPPSNPAFVYADGIGTLLADRNTLPNTPTTWIRNTPATLAVTQNGQRFAA